MTKTMSVTMERHSVMSPVSLSNPSAMVRTCDETRVQTRALMSLIRETETSSNRGRGSPASRSS